ncbi:phage tail tip fiber protein, partial [Pantoea ananatis]
MSNVNADDLIGSVVEEYLQSDDGKALLTPLITDPNALAESILANYDDVEQQWANFGENKAGIIEAKRVAADAQSSVADLRTDVTSRFDKNEAAISERMVAYTDAAGGSAIYTLKAGIKYGGANYDAGMSVAVTINGSSVDTRFAVNANQFVVINGSGKNVYSPFVIKDGQVLISQAFIGEGWITNA